MLDGEPQWTAYERTRLRQPDPEMAGHPRLERNHQVLDCLRIDVDALDDQHVVAAAENLEANSGKSRRARRGPNLNDVAERVAHERPALPVNEGEDHLAARAILESNRCL